MRQQARVGLAAAVYDSALLFVLGVDCWVVIDGQAHGHHDTDVELLGGVKTFDASSWAPTQTESLATLQAVSLLRRRRLLFFFNRRKQARIEVFLVLLLDALNRTFEAQHVPVISPLLYVRVFVILDYSDFFAILHELNMVRVLHLLTCPSF